MVDDLNDIVIDVEFDYWFIFVNEWIFLVW